MIRVKICGIRSLEEALAARDAGAWAIGQVFAPSPRKLEVDMAAAINRKLGGTILKIGVFVNEEPENLRRIVASCRLDMVQLHGEEEPAYLEEVSVPVIKSFRVRGRLELERVRRWRPWAYLFDSYRPGIYGGTGESFDWSFLQEIARQERIILAGGLKAENVGRAIHQLRPMAVDVSSGVEHPGGGKDPAKIREFINMVQEQAT
ncbi:MAG: phosphoribosylanthranilate isomerase [Syntrophomonas sp.]|uniref:phosphoribosylanthranilate isomerase n=1 Tax=Syntrophomonas sp. TaxID=2053627 RepID=UPI00262E5AB0|nr:phosphoribosylanthranilate isomerase [Syntrophomonas sp.]MDD2510087.1 phosphoribosylanthranilate isomerase [Syntrophomonas sp.]MDD4627074.1 phosphoribosylanthranilate isomerase [Syntrophomonas sp.]